MSYAGARALREDDQQETEQPRSLRLVEADARAGVDPAPSYAENGRRTVTITGQPVPARRRPPRAQAHIQARPDRIALWAFMLGLFLVFMAVATASA